MDAQQQLQEQAALQKLAGAQAAGSGGNYFQIGNHLAEISQIIFKTGFKGVSVVAEWVVVSTNHADENFILDDRASRMYEGQRCASVFKMDNDAHVASLKQLAETLFEVGGIKEAYASAADGDKLTYLKLLWGEQTDAEGKVVTPAGQVFQGIQLDVQVTPHTSTKGNFYTKEYYSVPA